jgi:hypothetical protein
MIVPATVPASHYGLLSMELGLAVIWLSIALTIVLGLTSRLTAKTPQHPDITTRAALARG